MGLGGRCADPGLPAPALTVAAVSRTGTGTPRGRRGLSCETESVRESQQRGCTPGPHSGPTQPQLIEKSPGQSAPVLAKLKTKPNLWREKGPAAAERQPCARPGTRNGTPESLAWPVAAPLAAGETEAQSLRARAVGELRERGFPSCRGCVCPVPTSLARRDRVFKPECASSGSLRGPGACGGQRGALDSPPPSPSLGWQHLPCPFGVQLSPLGAIQVCVAEPRP